MLRKVRIILAVLFFAGITLLLAGIGNQWWGWMAKLQFLPSCLALNFAVIAGVLLLTLAFGRIYCSVICPMGVFQDIVIWIRRQAGLLLHKVNERKIRKYAADKKAGKDVKKPSTIKREVKHFEFNKERWWVRYPVLVLTIAAIFAGLQVVVALIAPYSAYGRMVRTAVGAGSGESLAPALIITAVVTFVVIVLCAWLWGRAWCNTVCPVGTVLGLVGRHPLMHIKIDESKCAACGRCGRGCKSSCIDMDNHTVDYSRCVDCFDCLGRCKENALSFSLKPGSEAPDKGRRNFLAASAAIIGTSAVAKAVETDGGLAALLPKQEPERKGRLVPFGAKGEDNFYSHCTACQLCVSSCPNRVLKPSSDLEHLAQPKMSYTDGFCRPECTICSNVCPAGAILPVKTREEKFNVRIGTARINEELCVVRTKGDKCGNCAAHCPAGAIRMVREEGLANPVPAVIETRCIGCGECEYLCPARPVSAIVVDGLEEHQTRTV